MTASVCVLIPTYNQAGLVLRAVDSALMQTWPALEVVVVDDASSDGTAQAIRSRLHDRRLRYLRSEVNRGRVGNYRHALADCTHADWVVNLDGDDFFIDPDFIAHAMQAIARAGAAEVLFYQGRHAVRGDGPGLSDPVPPAGGEQVVAARDYFFRFFERKHFSHLTTLYRRDAALACGFYEFDVLSSDMYSVLKLCLSRPEARVILGDRVSAVWYQHQTNTSRSAAPGAHLRNVRLLGRLARLAAAQGQRRADCLAWQLRLLWFYGLLYAGVVWRRRPRPSGG